MRRLKDSSAATRRDCKVRIVVKCEKRHGAQGGRAPKGYKISPWPGLHALGSSPGEVKQGPTTAHGNRQKSAGSDAAL